MNTTPSEPAPRPADDPSTVADEMAAIPYEPLLPIEKKLIVYSLILGVTLLGLLYWLSNAFFPVT